MTLSLTQCTLSRLSLRHAVRRPRSPSLHFTCASRDRLIIGIYLSRLTRLSRQVLDRPTVSEWNKLSQDVRSKPPTTAVRSALLKVPGPVKSKIISEP